MEGKKVTIGVRSHQVEITDTPENAMPMVITMVENLGKELLVNGEVEGNHVRLTVEDTER